ncbi:hypothetical protein [Mesonia sp.]|uniref:hypothetical protein n=1 Tax=Mesonia sp. TaxID=1960830 RepID=UPI00176FD22E|nr:hypothetical protein [Mesonia sp.]HIB36984.1 hypothetical protein [Mesonia sp.]
MSKQFENWLKEQDQAIREGVITKATTHNVDVKFAGYYFEDHNLWGSTGGGPVYKSFSDYDEQVPNMMFIEHVRYWFKLSYDEREFMASVHIYEASANNILFSIEELAESSVIKDKVVSESTFETFEQLLLKK